ncbi:ATP synthase F1 subunit delta [Candidatus Bandiella euplotis]|uniref:ATP synthase subunit delta n=1 Tax=Candidatus Bandiella euplotis TaxID=1664265 RepID=A0ABZ0ULW2_9RICK|nr:ATP synthase F1 subunit delta [Candidatus Bandiella woodruffii]WPX96241.1 ATP synthase subunit delta [Candidatus Bandiella woodruffii]
MGHENLTARRYAKALFLVANDLKKLDEVFAELNSFWDRINENKKIKKLLLNELVPQNVKLIFCNTVLQKMPVSNVVRKFINMLIFKKRLFLLQNMILSFKDLLYEYTNTRVVEITLAKKMEGEVIETIKKQLMKYFQDENLEFNFEFDARILGGMVIKTNSNMFDFSILSKLYKIQRATGYSTLKIIN